MKSAQNFTANVRRRLSLQSFCFWIRSALQHTEFLRRHHGTPAIKYNTNFFNLTVSNCNYFECLRAKIFFNNLQLLSLLQDEDLTPEQIAVLQKAFNSFDHQKCGSISTEMVADILRLMGQPFDKKILEELIDEVDEDSECPLNWSLSELK